MFNNIAVYTCSHLFNSIAVYVQYTFSCLIVLQYMCSTYSVV